MRMPQTLLDDENVLRADGDDEAQAKQETRKRVIQKWHTSWTGSKAPEAVFGNSSGDTAAMTRTF